MVFWNRFAYHWSSIRWCHWRCCPILQGCIWQGKKLWWALWWPLVILCLKVQYKCFVHIYRLTLGCLFPESYAIWIRWKHEEEGHSCAWNWAQVMEFPKCRYIFRTWIDCKLVCYFFVHWNTILQIWVLWIFCFPKGSREVTTETRE